MLIGICIDVAILAVLKYSNFAFEPAGKAFWRKVHLREDGFFVSAVRLAKEADYNLSYYSARREQGLYDSG